MKVARLLNSTPRLILSADVSGIRRLFFSAQTGKLSYHQRTTIHRRCTLQESTYHPPRDSTYHPLCTAGSREIRFHKQGNIQSHGRKAGSEDMSRFVSLVVEGARAAGPPKP